MRTSTAIRVALLGVVIGGSILALASGPLLWGPHLAFEVMAVAAFVALLALEARQRWLRAPVVVGSIAVLIAFALTFPPRESADVWSYVMYGRIVLHGDDPYTTPPSTFPHDRWLGLVRPVWRDTPSLYGPLFNRTAAGVVEASHGSALRARLGFQIVAALALAAMLWLLWRWCRDPAALAFLGLNPLVVLGVVNGGHNDALVGLAVLGGVVLAERGRAARSGVALGLGVLIKVVALLPAAITALWLWLNRGIGRAARATAAGLALMLGGYYWLGGSGAWRALRAETGLTNRFSMWRLAAGFRPDADDTPAHYLHLASGGSLAWVPMTLVLVLALAAALPALRESSPRRAVAVAAAVYLLGGLYVLPWYAMWVLPLLAATWRWRLAWIVFGQQAALTVAYALAIHRHFGPVASVARVGYFEVLAVVQAALVVWLAWSGATSVLGRRARGPRREAGGPALWGRPTAGAEGSAAVTAWPPSSTSRPSVRRSGS